jgi:hypothetical protein
MKRHLCLLLLLAVAPVARSAPVPVVTPLPAITGPFQVRSLVLYQTSQTLTARLGPQGVPELSAYISRINAAVAPIFAAAPVQAGVTGALVIGLKPGGAVRSWVAERPGALPDSLVSQITAAINALPAIPVAQGPVAFGIRFTAWGGGAPITDATHPAPIPQAWIDGATGAEEVPDGVFARIWP